MPSRRTTWRGSVHRCSNGKKAQSRLESRGLFPSKDGDGRQRGGWSRCSCFLRIRGVCVEVNKDGIQRNERSRVDNAQALGEVDGGGAQVYRVEFDSLMVRVDGINDMSVQIQGMLQDAMQNETINGQAAVMVGELGV